MGDAHSEHNAPQVAANWAQRAIMSAKILPFPTEPDAPLLPERLVIRRAHTRRRGPATPSDVATREAAVDELFGARLLFFVRLETRLARPECRRFVGIFRVT
jgi:hypothetical protein